MSSRLPVISALSLAVLISATPTVVGQSLAPSRRGGFAGALAHAHYLSNPSSQVLAPFIKEPGNQTSDPLQWSQQSYPGGPDYDLNTMFPGIAALVEINGHSTGNDDIPEWEDKLDGSRGPKLSQIGWMQIAVSVNNSAQGLPGSVIRRRTNFSPPKRNTPGAELIGYYFSESTGIDPSLPGVSLLEQSSEAIGFSAMPPTLPDQDISALDWGLGVQTTASGGLTPQLLFTHRRGIGLLLGAAASSELVRSLLLIIVVVQGLGRLPCDREEVLVLMGEQQLRRQSARGGGLHPETPIKCADVLIW